MIPRRRALAATPARAFAATLALALPVTLAACGDDDPAAPANQLAYSLEVDLPAGGEVHRCQFVTTRDAETWIVGGSHLYSAGSHHMLLFRTDLTTIPPDLAGVRDCYEADKSIMSHVRGLVYGAQKATGDADYPAGVGLPLAANEVLLMQAHYINTSSKPAKARVDVTLRTGPPAATRAGTLFFYDPFIHVPANASARATWSCAVPHAIHLLTASSHMHKRGVGYRAFIDSPDSAGTSPFYSTDSWDHPNELAAPLDLAAGSVIRYECDYQNTGAATFLQGQSAETNEMCMFIGVYYPAMEQADEFCMRGPHRPGTGARTCAETLGCVQQCPPGTAPRLGLGNSSPSGAQVDVHECYQKCFVASCPSAWTPFAAQATCARTKCSVECGSGQGADCTNCALANCGPEVNACFAQRCD